MFLKVIYVSSSQIILGKLHLFDSVECNCKCSCWKLNCLFYCYAFLTVTRCNQLLTSCFSLLISWQPDDQQALQNGYNWLEIGNSLDIYLPSNDKVINYLFNLRLRILCVTLCVHRLILERLILCLKLYCA